MNDNSDRKNVILIRNTKSQDTIYLRYDPDCGYVFSSSGLYGAKFFSLEEAYKQYNELLNEKDRTVKFSDGTEGPATFIHTALNLSYKNPSGEGVLAIAEVKTLSVEWTDIQGKLLKMK